jgi:phage baseplate assembly protein W
MAYRFRSEKYVSREFRDLAISFASNPFTKDFGAVKNENAIKQSVRNLVLTMFEERPFQPDVGSGVRKLLFENWDPFTQDAIKNEIENTLERLETRIEIENIDLIDNSDLNEIQISLEYKIVGQAITQEVEFLLEKT